jgi:glycerol-3-phosphate dehydrogenase
MDADTIIGLRTTANRLTAVADHLDDATAYFKKLIEQAPDAWEYSIDSERTRQTLDHLIRRIRTVAAATRGAADSQQGF